VEALGLAGVSKDQVSRLCGGLDEQVTAFRERPLEGAYPYVWLDAKVEKVRAGGRVEHHALVVAYGVDACGQREVIGLDVGVAETQGRSGGSSCAAWSVVVLRASSWSSPMPTKAARPRLPRSWARPGSAAPSTSSATPSATALRISSSWSGRRSARSSGPPTSRRPGGC
jgi:Transposase, Mutator family